MAVPSPSRFPFWIVLGGFLLPLVYLPTLATRFDFVDDGNLVYPSPPMPTGERLDVVWQKVADNYDHLGPFRPVLWVHWECAAEVWQGSELGWRATRLVWCMFAAMMLLWLMRELGLPPFAALVAGAVAMWNPYRNEIWTSLTLSEGVAMPYAMLALVCARRAMKSPRPIVWDLVGMACVLAAMGCKNTFAALVPVQMFLRLAEDGLPLRDGWRRHGKRAVLLGVTLLAPAVHYVYFRMNWHEGQYLPGGPTVAQARRVVSGLIGAESLEFMGAGYLLAAVVLAKAAGLDPFVRYRAAVGGGLLLLLGGAAMYLPMDAMSGRYTMPGVWGFDVLIAVLLAGVASAAPSRWRTAAVVALLAGLTGVAVASIGKQQKFAAKADLLWQMLKHVERTAPADAAIAWVCGSGPGDLNVEEGIHFQWHLGHRERTDVRIVLVDGHGQPVRRREVASTDDAGPKLAAWGINPPPGWGDGSEFHRPYWFGRRQFVGHVGVR
jgi:hypothetical protein